MKLAMVAVLVLMSNTAMASFGYLCSPASEKSGVKFSMAFLIGEDNQIFDIMQITQGLIDINVGEIGEADIVKTSQRITNRSIKLSGLLDGQEFVLSFGSENGLLGEDLPGNLRLNGKDAGMKCNSNN